jgi:hypothetical protein
MEILIVGGNCVFVCIYTKYLPIELFQRYVYPKFFCFLLIHVEFGIYMIYLTEFLIYKHFPTFTNTFSMPL